MFARWSLKTKLLFSFAIVAICLLIVGGVGYVGLNRVTAQFDHVAQVNFQNAVALADIRGAQKDIVIAASLLLGTHASAQDVSKSRGIFDDANKRFESAAQTYESSPWAPGEEALWNETKQTWAPFKELSMKLIALSSTGEKADEETRDSLGGKEFVEAQNAFLAKVKHLIDFQSEDSKKWIKSADDAADAAKTASLAIVLGGTLFALLLGYFFSGSLSRQLNTIASELLANADSVATASQQVSASGNELSSSAAEQAAALQETSSSVEEVNAMVQKNAENARQSQELSKGSHEAVLTGKRVVDSVIESVNQISRSNDDIKRQTEASNRQISEIVQVISEIGTKTKVINDIVFQTKLLSFNASVEAARAGEHGKGFAVVAEEVGNLAQMSGNAAKEISQLLDGSIQKVETIVRDTKSQVESLTSVAQEKIDSGVNTAKECGQVLDEVVKNVSEVNQRIAEISTASNEQAQGVEEINKAMSQMDQVTQQNATVSQQVATAAEQLATQASSLRSAAEKLMQTVRGDDSEMGSASPVPVPIVRRKRADTEIQGLKRAS